MATIAVAFAGLLVGALAAYISERGIAATAAGSIGNAFNRTQATGEPSESARDKIVANIISGDLIPERLVPPATYLAPTLASTQKPKIIIIIDDMGVDRWASEQALLLPGPVTYSFLPYARNVEDTVAKARAAGGEIMLHLPMEPRGDADPGPYALKSGMTGGAFIEDLEWNLSQFTGYVGVNNHMGSKLTANVAAMKTLLAHLNHKNVFFLDSLTTGETAVREAANAIGVEVFARDVFLDDAVGDKNAIRQQLSLAERIAHETGYVVAIGHPRKETLEVLGPWLTSAPMRGFELVYASDLKTITKQPKPTALAAAPALRL
ncbi:divergent polysaccharide deacetylase family protein [Hyphococcus sp.]|uniref:divergent polysaccharide deacetylase family protein n=1 Tax=Hyphococcus sp. TaxID=2038636 RepID=UPI003CCC1CDB